MMGSDSSHRPAVGDDSGVRFVLFGAVPIVSRRFRELLCCLRRLWAAQFETTADLDAVLEGAASRLDLRSTL
jgi:hypothetical protein